MEPGSGLNTRARGQKMPWGKLTATKSAPPVVSITQGCFAFNQGLGVGAAPVVAIPLGNLHPYFTFSVSETFFDTSTKPFFSHT